MKGENKGNSWKGKEGEEGKIRTFCESRKPSEIEGSPANAAEVLVGGVENAEEVQKENNVNPPPEAESYEKLEKKSRLCTEGAGAEVEVHR